MDAILIDHLDRVEKSLTTLVESITSYNPSVTAAEELVTASNDLTAGLLKLLQHQSNHAKLLSLYAKAEAISNQNTNAIQTLADLRKEVSSLPATAFQPGRRSIPLDELLNYAKSIAPNSRQIAARRQQSTKGMNRKLKQEAKDRDVIAFSSDDQAASSFAESGEGATGAPEEASFAIYSQDRMDIAGSSQRGTKELTENDQQWLNPVVNLDSVPWPNEDMLRAGVLARLQGMSERGENLQLDGDEVGVDKGKAQASTIAQTLTESNGLAIGQLPNGSRRTVSQPPPKTEEKSAVFGGMDLYDPDEE
ncbi:hypothetical protein MMC25_007520 [Agyrium rufum]|nr:hypothetical protein [Agyrium rufum]